MTQQDKSISANKASMQNIRTFYKLEKENIIIKNHIMHYKNSADIRLQYSNEHSCMNRCLNSVTG